MHIKNILVLVLLAFNAVAGFSQNGTIKGSIVSFKNEPLSGVNLTIQNTSLGSATDKKGQFLIADIPAGTYTLVASSIGYSAIKQNVIIEAGKTINFNLQLSEDKQILQEVTVTGKVNNYRQTNSSIATRTDVPLMEVPQAAQVITQQVIKDKQAFTLNDISRVITGVKANNNMGGFSMRGFTGYYPFDASFITFNGIRGNLYLWSQQPLLYNVESVEALRGPASVLFSEGMPGGVIKFTTKKPQVENRFEFNASYGSWNMARIAADATGAISKNKKLLYRAIVGYDRSNSFRDYQKVENLFIAPSLTYLFSAKTNVNVEVNYADAKTVQQYDRGTYVKKQPDGSYDFNYYPDNLTVQSPTDFGKTKNTSAALTFNHKMDDNFSFTFVQRYINNNFDWTDHFVSGAIKNDSINRGYSTWDYDQFSWQTTAFVNYKVNTGKVGHSFLAGIDYNNYGWNKNDYRNSPTTRISILNPNYNNDIPALDPSRDYYDDNKQTINLVGGYLQDQISFGSKIKLLLSIRHDSYKLKQTPLSAKDDSQGDTSNATAWMPRAGIVYMPAKNMSFYGSYNKSFNPQLSNSGGRGGPFPPRTAEQFEVGYKAELFKNALSAMVSLYSINYRNILAADPLPNNPNHQSVVSGTRSQGVEITLQGNIKNLNIITGYAYNNHELTSDNTLGKKGFRYVNAPKNVANAWMKYNFTKSFRGVGIGAGARYMSNQVGNLANQDFLIPESTVIDAAMNYGVSRFNFQFNVNNLTNKRYFNGGLSRVTVASLGNPINFRFGVNYLIN